MFRYLPGCGNVFVMISVPKKEEEEYIEIISNLDNETILRCIYIRFKLKRVLICF
jgi:hypothetical protein